MWVCFCTLYSAPLIFYIYVYLCQYSAVLITVNKATVKLSTCFSFVSFVLCPHFFFSCLFFSLKFFWFLAGLSIFMILITFTYRLISYIFVVTLGFIVYPSNNISPHIYCKNLTTVCFYFPLRTLVYCYHTFYFNTVCCSKPCNLLLFLL